MEELGKPEVNLEERDRNDGDSERARPEKGTTKEEHLKRIALIKTA
jgi:hypothetical protein